MSSKLENLSILLVESNPHSLHLVKRTLEEHFTLQSIIDHASTREEALEKLQRNTYDILVAEADKEEGKLDLVEEIAQLNLNLPFVLLLPVRDDTLVRRAMRLGIADCIVKSESQFHELADRLRNCYQKYHATHERRIEGRPKLKRARKPEETDEPSIYDSLTGLYTHSYLHDFIVREFSRAARYRFPIASLMIDIDHFRNINETLGYNAGEQLLKECAALLFENCRLSDFVARYGGEEFVVILPHESYQGAAEAANRLRTLFAEHVFRAPAFKDVHLTVSIGISAFPEDTIQQRGEILTFASQALFRAKANGRNCTVMFKDIAPVFGEGLPAFKISEEKIVEFQRKMSEISTTARRAYTDASKALILALETKDNFTAGHAASVAKLTLLTAEALGMSADEAEVVQHAALLHDIGKICIPDEVLLKPGRLTLQEFETMKQHPYLGYKILKPIKFLQQEAILVLHHHEWFNGEGYPCRLKGNEIPLGARIIAVIDSYDTIRMSGGRYKKTSTLENTINELIACSGVQFDAEVVRVFIEVLKKRGELKTDDYNKARLEEILAANT